MTAAELRARLTEIAAAPTDALTDHGDNGPGSAPTTLTGKPLVPAAVLVPVVMGRAPGILLTKRTSHLTRHAGQISFPGGRIDPGDTGPEAAALREAWEEIGLDAGSVEILGRMRNYVTGTGYRITPILGLVPPDLVFQLSSHEVEAVFELPMRIVLDVDAPRRQRQHVGGGWREYWVWPHPEHYIWGATAAILVDLAEQLRASLNPKG